MSGKVHNKTRIWFLMGFPTQASSLASLLWEAKCQFSRAVSSLLMISFALSDCVCSFCGCVVRSGHVSGTGLKFKPSRSLKNELNSFGCAKVDYSSCPKMSKVLFSSFLCSGWAGCCMFVKNASPPAQGSESQSVYCFWFSLGLSVNALS